MNRTESAPQYDIDVAVNLALIGSLPARSVRQVRIHWLLNLVDLESTIPLRMDLGRLDRLLQRLWSRDLRPGFEIMGNPSSHFSDFRDADQVDLWREVVRRVVEHYVQRYGIGRCGASSRLIP